MWKYCSKKAYLLQRVQKYFSDKCNTEIAVNKFQNKKKVNYLLENTQAVQQLILAKTRATE